MTQRYPRYRDPNWHYVPAAQTDVSKTFERVRAESAEAPAPRPATVVASPPVQVTPLTARILLQRFARRQG